MSYQLSLPYHSRSEPISQAVSAVDGLPAREQQLVAREILLEAATDSRLQTVGDLLDFMEGATREQRRAMVDHAREKAGLQSASSLEWEQEHLRRQKYPEITEVVVTAGTKAAVVPAEQEAERQRMEAELRRRRERREAVQAEREREAKRAQHEQSELDRYIDASLPRGLRR